MELEGDKTVGEHGGRQPCACVRGRRAENWQPSVGSRSHQWQAPHDCCGQLVQRARIGRRFDSGLQKFIQGRPPRRWQYGRRRWHRYKFT